MVAETDLANERWRTGRTLGRTMYARTGGDDWKADTEFGMLDTRPIATRACADHNALLDLTWLAEAGFGVEVSHYPGMSWCVTPFFQPVMRSDPQRTAGPWPQLGSRVRRIGSPGLPASRTLNSPR